MKRKALTIMEMMVATAIFVIISMILLIVLMAGKNSWDIGSTYLILQQQARIAMTAMINELSESGSVVVDRFLCNSNCNGEYIEFQVPVVDNNYEYQNSIYQTDGSIKWGAEGKVGNKIRFAAVNDNFLPAYNGKLVRLTDQSAPPPPEPFCGDGTCDATETCSDCEVDCGPCSSSMCFLAGTPILMADGSVKMIEEIKVGDMVLAFDEEKKITVADQVTKFMVHKTHKYLLVNEHLKVTANHPVYSNGQYLPIGELKIGNTLMNKDSQPEKIFSIQEIPQEALVYDLEVNPFHNYFAGGYLVHNKTMPEQDPGGEGGWGFLDRFKFLGLAFAEDPTGNLGASTNYDIKVIADYITQMEVIRDSGNPSPAAPQTLIIKIHARKNTMGGVPVEVVVSSQVTFQNSP